MKIFLPGLTMKKNLILLFGVLLLYFLLPLVKTSGNDSISRTSKKKNGPITILCLGDSITRGAYRRELRDMLTEAGLEFDYIGRSGAKGVPGDEHDGDSGRRLVRMLRNNRAIAKDALAANPNPDIILLLIGINDLIVNRNTVEATLNRMGLLLDELKEYAPKTKIIVGNLIPNASDDPVRDSAGYDPAKTYVNSEDKVRAFNKSLPAIIESKRTQGISVDWVDLHSSMTRYDLADGIHPNNKGYEKMASVWFKAVMAAAAERGVVSEKSGTAKLSKYVVETLTGPRLDLPNWVVSGADTDGFNGLGQYKIASPYRGLRRIVGNGSFESLFELTNINLESDGGVINLGFVPRDGKSKVILMIGQKGMRLLFRDLGSEPAVNEKYENQVIFQKPPKSLKVKITWQRDSKRWRFFYSIDRDEPTAELPMSRKGLYFTKELEEGTEALVFVRRGSTEVDHFEFGPNVKGSQYYKENPPARITPPKFYNRLGKYYDCSIPGAQEKNFVGAEFEIWIPNNVTTLEGIIVRQHGAGGNGRCFAHDLHFQALAAKYRFALMGSFMKATENFGQWTDPKEGSGPAFIEALEILAIKTGHAELNTVPWILWGHSAGGHWVNKMARAHQERVIALISRSGHGSEYIGSDLKIPNLQIAGEKEVDPSKSWYRNLLTTGQLRGVAIEPGVGHACTNSRFLTVAFIEEVLAEMKKNNQKPLKRTGGWLGDINTFEIAPYDSFSGDKNNSYWLVNENFARQWKQFVITGDVTDATPPKAPIEVTAKAGPAGRITIRFKAHADIQTGIREFNIYRNNKKIASVPGQGWNRGDEPDPIDCAATYLDQLDWNNLKEIDSPVLRYSVTAVNYSGLESRKKSCRVSLIKTLKPI
jgi:lysophospholipase L1-like esterase/pimeloyl-ACP methyl ester carboxylesterase